MHRPIYDGVRSTPTSVLPRSHTLLYGIYADVRNSDDSYVNEDLPVAQRALYDWEECLAEIRTAARHGQDAVDRLRKKRFEGRTGGRVERQPPPT